MRAPLQIAEKTVKAFGALCLAAGVVTLCAAVTKSRNKIKNDEGE